MTPTTAETPAPEPKTTSAKTATPKVAPRRILVASRKASTAYLDGVETGIARLTRIERAVAERSRISATTTLLTAHADLTEKITKAGVSRVRDLIAA